MEVWEYNHWLGYLFDEVASQEEAMMAQMMGGQGGPPMPGGPPQQGGPPPSPGEVMQLLGGG